MSSDAVLSPQVFHILVSLAERDQHGYAIMQDVAARTGGKLRLSPGTLYGSIKRMLEEGSIVELRAQAIERRRRYRLTAQGRQALKAEIARMTEMLEQAHQVRSHALVPKRT
jgi:DNA-binding PadR family transcriptional regulator